MEDTMCVQFATLS